MVEVIPGGYVLAPMESCKLPQEVATGFTEVIGPMVGSDFVPVLYVGSQVVAGTNHMILCRQKPVVPNPPEHLVKIVLNSAPTTGTWSLVSLEQIV